MFVELKKLNFKGLMMILSKKMELALNDQINAEFFSAYLYKSMAAYFESIKLGGFAHWMELQAQEEAEHGQKLYSYIHVCCGRVVLKSIEGPKIEWKDPLDVFCDALAHEKKVTKLIHNLVDLARKENDHTTESFLKWFVDEQVEEESSADEIVQKLKEAKKNDQIILFIDGQLGQRKN